MTSTNDTAAGKARPLQLYQFPDGRRFIAADDHRRMIAELHRIASVFGEPVTGAMNKALETGHPQGGGAEGAKAHFGKHLEAMAHIAGPVMVAIDGMVPHFRTWLEVTRFGDDRFMIQALVEMANKMAAIPRPAGTRMRPARFGPPKFH
jgi:hypothetical protein